MHGDDMRLAVHSSEQQLVSVPATKRSQTHAGPIQEGTMCDAVGEGVGRREDTETAHAPASAMERCHHPKA